MKRLQLVLIMILALSCITVIATESVPDVAKGDTAGTYSHWSGLPLMSQRFVEMGVKPPKPFGVAVGAMYMSQNFKMVNIEINDQPVQLFSFSKVSGNDVIVMPRIDIWITPFLDLYIFGGYNQGFLDATIAVQDPEWEFINFDIPLKFEYSGRIFGGGGTFVAGYKNIFTMADANYSSAKLNTFDSELDLFMFSLRLGYIFELNKSSLLFWAGTMYQDMDQTLIQEFQLIEGGDMHKLKIDVGAKDPFNLLIGSRFEFKQRYGIVVEGGFIGRKQIIANLEYRF